MFPNKPGYQTECCLVNPDRKVASRSNKAIRTQSSSQSLLRDWVE